ncbi:hypothetical protein L1887_57673 [Cichorium endivia]|nr:hypothetical protein L1887_57673 [Cichorium endivia]
MNAAPLEPTGQIAGAKNDRAISNPSPSRLPRKCRCRPRHKDPCASGALLGLYSGAADQDLRLPRRDRRDEPFWSSAGGRIRRRRHPVRAYRLRIGGVGLPALGRCSLTCRLHASGHLHRSALLGNGARHGPHDGHQRLLRASWPCRRLHHYRRNRSHERNRQMSAAKSSASSFAPLAQPVFAVLWAATVLGNTGSFMRDVASSWLMTDLSASPAAVAMVQAAGTLPIFLLAIPAGVLTDILDRRKFLIAVQLLLASVSVTLMVLAQTGLLSVSALIGLTFLGGIGAALMGPTWQAIVPELVKREDIKSAVALNSLGINIARSIGPAAGGILLAAFGAAFTYGADVASYFVQAAACRPAAGGDFFAFASAVWALLPLVARQLLGGDASFYGILLGAVGAGAIGGALVMPKLRERFDADALLLGAALTTALVMAGLSFAPPKWLAIIILLFLGGAWITALTTLNGAAQAVLPNWVRGRGLAVYLTVFNGAMTAGSLGWGAVW